MNDRVERLKKSLKVTTYPLCVEKICLLAESYSATEGIPTILRRAKALAHVLDNMPVFIEPDELIVGNGASRPMGLEIDPDYGFWSEEEIESLRGENYELSNDDEQRLYRAYEKTPWKTLIGTEGEIFWGDDRLRPFVVSGVVLPPWKSKGEGGGGGYAQAGMGLGPGFMLMGVDLERVLTRGVESIIEEAESEIAALEASGDTDPEKQEFLRAVIIVHQAFVRFAQRVAAVADESADVQTDPKRRAELKKIAENCRRVPAKPARDFWEALQSLWFLFLLLTPSPTAAAGRFDQYMYPFYRDDLEAGRISREEALELLVCLRIKDMQLNRTSGAANRKKNAGMAKWHNFTIGGVKADGSDAANDVSYLLLEAAKLCRVPHHTITLRVHEGTPEDLMIKALEVVRTGIGLPAFVGDRSYIRYFTDNGVEEREAREYILTGCLDGNLPGKSRTVAIGMFIVPLVFDIFLHNGTDPKSGELVGIKTGEFTEFRSFEELRAAFKRQLSYFMELAAERNNIELSVTRDQFPDPFRSSLMHEALAVGRDMMNRPMPFENAAVLNPVGMINVGDSLAAINKVVFVDRRADLSELKRALDTNWVGHESLRDLCLKAPKYGNDDDFVDSIVADLYAFWAAETQSFPTIYGGTHKPTAISITSHQPGGALTGATPDGRYAGEILADGTMSPMQGRDTHGPTAVLRSAMKIDQYPYQATLLNMKFHPTALKTEDDLRKLSALIRTYFDAGGKHMQFNVVDARDLREAQKRPEDFGDLVVRVAGYSAYFVQLPEAVQEEIICRSEHLATA